MRISDWSSDVCSSDLTDGAPTPSGSVPTLGGEAGAPGAGVPATPARDEVLGISPRITIESHTVTGSIALRRARFADLVLLKYTGTIHPESPPVTLLSPARPAHSSSARLDRSEQRRVGNKCS